MKNRKDFFDAFREGSQQLRQTPSSSAWRKLEQKLEARRRRRRVQIYRLSGIAAAIALLTTLAIFIPSLQKTKASLAFENPVPQSIETLSPVQESDAETIKAIEFSRRYQSAPSNIVEGNSSQKLVLAYHVDKQSKTIEEANMEATQEKPSSR